MNGRDPLAATMASTTETTGNPAAVRAVAIPAGPTRRSGAPKTTRSAAPTVAPVANAKTSSIGSTDPTMRRDRPAAPRTIQAVRRHERLNHGPMVKATRTAPARKAGLGKAAPANHDP